MKILLTGASGFVGLHIMRALKASGHQVIEATRSYGFDYTQMTSKEDWLPHLKDIDAVVNSVGIIVENGQQTFSALHYKAPVALFSACLELKNIRIVQISALGADKDAFTDYQLSKKSADDLLRSLPLEWFVLRPSLIYGEGGTSVETFKRMAALPILPLIDGGKQLVQPVHISDVTNTVLTCLTSSKINQTIDVVGPQPVRFKNWLQMIRTAQGKHPAIVLPIPPKISLIFAHLMKRFIPLMHPDNIRMLQKGNHSDATPLRDFIGYLPIDIEKGWDRS